MRGYSVVLVLYACLLFLSVCTRTVGGEITSTCQAGAALLAAANVSPVAQFSLGLCVKVNAIAGQKCTVRYILPYRVLFLFLFAKGRCQ